MAELEGEKAERIHETAAQRNENIETWHSGNHVAKRLSVGLGRVFARLANMGRQQLGRRGHPSMLSL
jgi:hypothetical protein